MYFCSWRPHFHFREELMSNFIPSRARMNSPGAGFLQCLLLKNTSYSQTLGSSSIYPHKHWQIFGHNKQGPLWTDWCWSQNNYKIEFPSDFSSSFFTFICTAADLEHWARCGFLLVGFLPCCGKTWNCSRKKSSCCMSACTSYLL